MDLDANYDHFGYYPLAAACFARVLLQPILLELLEEKLPMSNCSRLDVRSN